MGVFTLTETGGIDSVARDVEPGFPACARTQGEAIVHLMSWISKNSLLLLAALGSVGSVACQSGGIGDPCIPEDEYRTDFPGYTYTQVSVESRSFQCKSRVCLVAYFNGRVSCPYGQDIPTAQDPNSKCYLPGTPASTQPGASGACSNCVTGTVVSQFTHRQTEDAVYCSCRCDGPDSSVKYCDCPSGYSCESLVSSFGIEGGGGQLVGSYCVKEGTQIGDPASEIDQTPCSSQLPTSGACGKQYPDNI
jgi:hypothetical protein